VIPPGAIAPGVPTHPIYLPPGIWPSPGHPAHPIVLPPDAIAPGVPTHPIVLPPLDIWGGVPPTYPDIGGPGAQPGPEHPIVLPPGEIPPPGNGNSPTHPIYLPPDQPPTGDKALVHVFVAGVGGTWFLIDNPGANRPPPTGEPEPRPGRRG
jgi:hypothetical protein